MAVSTHKTLPLLSGVLTEIGPWSGLFGRSDYRVYPHSLGAGIAADSSGVTVSLYGRGEFTVNDYVVVCRILDYGGSPYYVPDMTRIRRITAVSSTDNEVTVGSAVSVSSGEYLYNLGADNANSPLTAPNFDGAPFSVYDDQVGTNVNSNKYFVTSMGGTYKGWVGSGVLVVDLLITDSSGEPVLAVPLQAVGPELLA